MRTQSVNADHQLAYLGIEVPDPDTLTPFLADVIGLVPGLTASSQTTTWRNDDRVHRIIVETGPATDATFIGLEAADDAVLDAGVQRLLDAGFNVVQSTADERAARHVDRMTSTMSPWGVRVELVTGLETVEAPFAAPLVPSGFLTADEGFGHLVFATTAYDESVRFLTDGLGMEQTDWVETEIAEGIELEIRFFHCNARHHTIAIARAPFELPQCLHHFMVEANDRDDVGSAFDRAWATDLGIPNGLGKHDNDGMFSFYVQSPAGFQVEFGYGGRTITDDWSDNRRYDQISAWGHQPLRHA